MSTVYYISFLCHQNSGRKTTDKQFPRGWNGSGAIEEIDKATREGKPGFSFEMWLTEYQKRGNKVPSPVVLDGGVKDD